MELFLYFFSTKTFDYICDRFGFSIEMIETNGLDIETILLDDDVDSFGEKILNVQEILNTLLLGDHFRVAFRKTA